MKPGLNMARSAAEAVARPQPRPTGFSLLELLLVILILVIVTTLYWKPLTKSRQPALRAACHSNLERMYIAMQIYANEHDGKLPHVVGARTPAQALAPLVPKYSSDTSVFICPGSKDSALPAGMAFTNHKLSYAYYMGLAVTNAQVMLSDQQVNASPKKPGQPVFSQSGDAPGNNHGKAGGNLMYCDGHIESIPALAPHALEVPSGVLLLNP